MILNELTSYFMPNEISAYGSNVFNKYNNYLLTISVKKDELMVRHEMADGYEHEGIGLLKHILSVVDIDYLKRINNDYERYTFYLKNIHKDLSNIFDTVATNKTYKNTFIQRKGFGTTEYIIPTERMNYIKDLPMGEEWDQWIDIKPIRLLDHNSNEYTLNVLQDRVSFKALQPSYAIISIDPIALAFMYYKFLDAHDFSSPMSTQVFLHRYVISKFMDDLQDIWLRNQFLSLFDIENEQEISKLNINTIVFNNMYGFVGHQYKDAMISIYRVMDDVRQRKRRPETLIKSLILSRSSISDYMSDIYTKAHIPPLRQYMWQVYLKDMRWVEFILKTYMLQPDYVNTRNMIKKLRIETEKLVRTRFWTNIRHILTRNIVEEHFNEMYELIKQDRSKSF